MIAADGARWWQQAGNLMTDAEHHVDKDSELKFH